MDIARAAKIIAAGGLVAFPTETVYGLGADAFNPTALVKVFAVKRRPRFDPLIIHIADMRDLERVAALSALTPEARHQAETLCQRLWPGPLTLILPKTPEVPDLATSGLPTAAIRFPAHPAAQALIRLSTRAIAAPSANLFGCLSPTTADHVREQLGNQVDMILDGGTADIGIESTVLDLTRGVPRILRPGGTPQERIEAIVGPVETAGFSANASASPGQLKSHYAPQTRLILHDIISPPYSPSKGYLFFEGKSRDIWLKSQGMQKDAANPRIQTLSETGSLTEGAARLFSLLHELDNLGLSAIHAEQVPEQGLGRAINDRLYRGSQRIADM